MTVATTPAVPLTLGECAATLRGLGCTERQADWLALGCLHSRVFTRSQYQARYDLSKQSASRFARRLLQAGIAREVRLPDRRAYRPTSICHVRARALYRALGKPAERGVHVCVTWDATASRALFIDTAMVGKAAWTTLGEGSSYSP